MVVSGTLFVHHVYFESHRNMAGGRIEYYSHVFPLLRHNTLYRWNDLVKLSLGTIIQKVA